MSNSGAWFSNRKAERICLLLIGIIMALLFWKLFTVQQRDFAEVYARIDNGTMINLNAVKPGEAMSGFFKKGIYFENPKDIAFIAATEAAGKVPGAL